MPVKKILNSLLFRSIAAVAIGMAVVTAFVALLSLYGVAREPAAAQTAIQSLKFPENEKMLDAMSAQLAREGAALGQVEPAAGDAAPKK